MNFSAAGCYDMVLYGMLVHGFYGIVHYMYMACYGTILFGKVRSRMVRYGTACFAMLWYAMA
jgi:hypothetical protein